MKADAGAGDGTLHGRTPGADTRAQAVLTVAQPPGLRHGGKSLTTLSSRFLHSLGITSQLRSVTGRVTTNYFVKLQGGDAAKR